MRHLTWSGLINSRHLWMGDATLSVELHCWGKDWVLISFLLLFDEQTLLQKIILKLKRSIQCMIFRFPTFPKMIYYHHLSKPYVYVCLRLQSCPISFQPDWPWMSTYGWSSQETWTVCVHRRTSCFSFQCSYWQISPGSWAPLSCLLLVNLSDILIWLHIQLLHPTLKRCGVPRLCMIVMWVLAVLCC